MSQPLSTYIKTIGIPSALSILAIGMFAGFLIVHKAKSETEYAARTCFMKNMLSVVSQTVVFCVEKDTGVTHYYPPHHASE
jgi:hypothetical protein